MFINCESSERKAKINDCQDSLYLSYYNFLKNGNKISGSRKAETSFNFTLDCIWFILSEFGKLDQFIFIILWQGVLMAKVIDAKITTASLARLGACSSRERAGGCSCISITLRPGEKMREAGSTGAAETSDSVTGEQPDSYLNYSLCLCFIQITAPSRSCHTNTYWEFQYLLIM